MKPLLFLLTLTSLTTFGQVSDTTSCERKLKKFISSLRDSANWTSGGHTYTITPGQNGEPDLLTLDIRMRPKQDTIRAILLVSYTGRKAKRIPFTMPGFVVQRLKTVVGSVMDYEVIYLDDEKKAIKAPLKVFVYVKD